MKIVVPQVRVIARTMPDDRAIAEYLHSINADEAARHDWNEPEDLIAFAGKICYRSFEPGLNPNVTKIREDKSEYLTNILKQAHGSVLEHVTWTFVLQDVSRVLTHELVRHRVGTATSQESMRYVRLTDIPFWFPTWAMEDDELVDRARTLMAEIEGFQNWMTARFELDAPGKVFADKKHKTSFMRRFAPAGHATSMVWTANVRTLRNVIETRTAPGAEEEIRMVFGQVARLMISEHPMLFGDFMHTTEGAFVPQWSKV